MAIVITDHLKQRLEDRNFPKHYPALILRCPDATYLDHATGSIIATKKKLPYGNTPTTIAIAYVTRNGDAIIKTIHPEKDEEIKRRVARGRYKIL